MRLDKFLSNLQYGSRSEIKTYIKDRRVEVDKKLVKSAEMEINPLENIVSFDGKEVFYRENIYLLLNKPQGYLSATKDKMQKTVLELIKEPFSRFDLKICGRLDIDTEGLLILTTDTMLVHQLTNPKKEIKKKYYCRLKESLGDFSSLEKGVYLKDGNNQTYLAKPAEIERIDDYSVYITVSEGKFHMVKRMFQSLGNEVIYLKRVSIGKYTLNNLKLGEYMEFLP